MGVEFNIATKFWELVSALRSESHILEEVPRDPRWKQYHDWYADWNRLVSEQVRSILDAELPDELCRSCFERSTATYIVRNGSLRAGSGMTSLEAYVRFGGSALEDVMEFGSFNLPG